MTAGGTLTSLTVNSEGVSNGTSIELTYSPSLLLNQETRELASPLAGFFSDSEQRSVAIRFELDRFVR